MVDKELIQNLSYSRCKTIFKNYFRYLIVLTTNKVDKKYKGNKMVFWSTSWKLILNCKKKNLVQILDEKANLLWNEISLELR